VRGLLIVNPRATTMAGNAPDLVVRSLAGLVDLEVARTAHRGHAHDLAAASDAEIVMVLGGDGAVNEAVNGLMARPQGPSSGGSARPQPPLIAVIPGGGANVFARALGLPAETAAAIGQVREAIAARRCRTIGLGLASDRYFTFSAGLGIDAEVVHEVDELRARGSRQSAALYLRAVLHWFYRGSEDRRNPPLTLEREGQPPVAGLFTAIVTNRSPWTYLGGRPLLPVPNPDFSSGLDLLALRSAGLVTIVNMVRQLMFVRSHPPRGRHLLSVHGAGSLTLRSQRPIAFQVDGEYLGETKAVDFRFVPHALRVAA
jgi:diacylglycerol kinase family enzyme